MTLHSWRLATRPANRESPAEAATRSGNAESAGGEPMKAELPAPSELRPSDALRIAFQGLRALGLETAALWVPETPQDGEPE
jgi:hypothetical protein